MLTNLLPVLTLLTTATTPQQQQIAHATPIKTNFGTTVQALTGDGFNDGYAKAKYDFANNLSYSDKCSPNSAYCLHYDAGYKTAWIQCH